MPISRRLRPWLGVVGWIVVVFGLTALSGWLVGEDRLLLAMLVYIPAVALVWWTNGRVRQAQGDGSRRTNTH